MRGNPIACIERLILKGWMESSEFYATKAQRALVVTSSIVLFGVTIGFFFLWLTGKAPVSVGITFLLLTITLGVRAVVLFRIPVVRIESDAIIVAGWFGTERSFNPHCPIDIYGNETAVIIKQGRSAVGLPRYVVGTAQFDQVLRDFGMPESGQPRNVSK